MIICERAEGCVFFSRKVKDIPGMADMVHRYYCKKDYARCARYMLMSAATHTNASLEDPEMAVIGRTMQTLLPSQEEKARSLIDRFGL